MTNKMNPEAKTKIVAALRSGKYKQGKGWLRVGECYCVMGVMCDQYSPTNWKLGRDDTYEYFGGVTIPPNTIESWLGIEWTTELTINGETAGISDHNDRDATFAQLADAIEEQL